VIKWLESLDHGIIYHISNSEWVSPIGVVPKNTIITLIRNDKSKLVLTQV